MDNIIRYELRCDCGEVATAYDNEGTANTRAERWRAQSNATCGACGSRFYPTVVAVPWEPGMPRPIRGR